MHGIYTKRAFSLKISTWHVYNRTKLSSETSGIWFGQLALRLGRDWTFDDAQFISAVGKIRLPFLPNTRYIYFLHVVHQFRGLNATLARFAAASSSMHRRQGHPIYDQQEVARVPSQLRQLNRTPEPERAAFACTPSPVQAQLSLSTGDDDARLVGAVGSPTAQSCMHCVSAPRR